MANLINESWVVPVGSEFVYVQMIRGADREPITEATVSSISRVITNKVTGVVQTDSITVAACVHDTPETDTHIRAEPFNFENVIEHTKITAKNKHTLQYVFTMATGSVIKSKELDIQGD